MTIYVWVHTGDSISGDQTPSSTSYFYQYLGVTGVGDSGSPFMQGYPTYFGQGFSARNMAITGTGLSLGGADSLVSLCPVWVDPIVANKASAPLVWGGGSAIPPLRFYIFSTAIGSNDAALGGFGDPTQYAAAVAAACVARKAAGFDRVIMSTLLPRGDVLGPSLETNRAIFNPLIRQLSWQQANGIDGIFDFASDPIMGNAATVTNTTYYLDTIHPTTVGYTLLIPYVASTLAAMKAGLGPVLTANSGTLLTDNAGNILTGP